MKYLLCDCTSDQHHVAGDTVELGPDSLSRLRAWGCGVLPVSGPELDHSILRSYGASRITAQSRVGIVRHGISHSLYVIPAGQYRIHIAARAPHEGMADIVPISIWNGGDTQITTWTTEVQDLDGLTHCVVPVRFDMPAALLAVKFAVVTREPVRLAWTAATIEVGQ